MEGVKGIFVTKCSDLFFYAVSELIKGLGF